MTEEVREKISKANRKNASKRVENGTHNLLGENNPSHKRVEKGTHNFLGGEISSKTSRKQVENGTHPFLGGDIQGKSSRKRVENGTHNFLGGDRVTALNIETGEVHRITKELYYSRRDIYFHPKSKVFKEWKKNH